MNYKKKLEYTQHLVGECAYHENKLELEKKMTSVVIGLTVFIWVVILIGG